MSNKKEPAAPGLQQTLEVKIDDSQLERIIYPLVVEINDLRARVAELEDRLTHPEGFVVPPSTLIIP